MATLRPSTAAAATRTPTATKSGGHCTRSATSATQGARAPGSRAPFNAGTGGRPRGTGWGSGHRARGAAAAADGRPVGSALLRATHHGCSFIGGGGKPPGSPGVGEADLARASFALRRPQAPGCTSGGRALDVATLDLEPGPGEAAAIGGGLVLRDEPFVASSLDLRPGVQAVGGQAARREEEVLAIDQGLEDFASDPERVGAEISPTGVDTIKDDVHGWRHEGVGGGTAQEVETGTEVLIEDRDFSVQDQRRGRQRGDRRRPRRAHGLDDTGSP